MIQLLFLVCMMAIPSIALHDPRCNSPDVQICVDIELDQSGRLNLVCVDSRSEIIITAVQWHKDGALHIMDSTGRIRKQGGKLIFENVLISDEGNWTCSNGSLSPPFKLFGECGYVHTRDACSASASDQLPWLCIRIATYDFINFSSHSQLAK